MAEPVVETERPERAPRVPMTAPLKQLQTEEDQSLKEWIDGMAGETTVRIGIYRISPKVDARGRNISGSLETVDERIDEDYLREIWGGGKYQLKILRPNGNGQYTYFKARTVQIAGDPKMREGGGDDGPAMVAAHGDGDLARLAFSSMAQNLDRANARSERAEQDARRAGSLDQQTLEAVLGPLRLQLNAALEESRDLRQKLFEATTRPPPVDPFRDRILEGMMSDSNTRIEAVRTQYETRIDRLQDSHRDELKRLEDRHRDDLRRLDDAHQRELKHAEKSLDVRSDSAKFAYESRVDSLKSENARLERELVALQARIGTLEAKKDQSPAEKAQELLTLREALEGLGGAGGDGDQKWYEKLFDVVGNSEAALALINKIGGPEGGAPAAAQPQLPPPGQPFKGPDGQIYIVGPDGQPHLVPASILRKQRVLAQRKKRQLAVQQAAATGAGAPAESPPGEEGAAAGDVVDDALVAAAAPAQAPIRPPDPGEVKIAINFMEAAIQRGADPLDFARSASSLIPADILRFIQRIGVDRFLNEVVRPEPGTPLATQRGRNFVRQVAKVLLEGAPE